MRIHEELTKYVRAFWPWAWVEWLEVEGRPNQWRCGWALCGNGWPECWLGDTGSEKEATATLIDLFGVKKKGAREKAA